MHHFGFLNSKCSLPAAASPAASNHCSRPRAAISGEAGAGSAHLLSRNPK